MAVADKLNANFNSFAIDVARYGVAGNALRSWVYTDGAVVLSDEFASVNYVQPEAEKVPVVELVMRDGTWYGRDNTAAVVVKIEVKDGEILSEEILSGSKEDSENYSKALERAKTKAIYGDTTGYGAGDASRFDGGEGTREKPYLVSTEEQLRYIAEAICEDETWEGKYFKQTADITLSEKDFMPIGFAIKAKIKGDPVLFSAYPFRGSFDGDNHTITGLRMGDRMNPTSLYTAAMFGFTGGDYESNILFGDEVLKTEFKNIKLRDIFINNEVPYDTYTAGLIGTGQNGVFIDNCSVTGKLAVKADDIASRGAGLAASMLRGAVTNCWTDVKISAVTEEGDVYAGGMFSVTNRINAINCYTLGDVYGTANTNNKVHIGGFTGMAGAFQYNCYAMGNVTSNRPTVDIGIMDGRIANIAYDRNCYFNKDAVMTENGVVIESVYTGADGTGSSKDVTFGKSKEEMGSRAFAELLNSNVENVASELEISDEELGGIMSIYYQAGPSGLRRWTIADGKAVFAEGGNTPEQPQVKAKLVSKWGSTYLIDENGEKLKGMQVVDGVTYYFNLKSGAMVKGSFVTIDDKTYYFGNDGRIVKGSFLTKWLSTYYLDENGVRAEGFTKIDNKLYYFKTNGHLAKSGWITEDGKKYYAKSDGRLAVSETIKRWGKKYTFDENGVLIK